MATPTSPSSSPRRHTSDNTGSPTARSRRATRSPWNQIAPSGESETIAADAAPSSPQSRAAIEQALSASGSASSSAGPSASTSLPAEDEILENGGGAPGNAGKKPAWNRPSNVAAEVGPVMGAASWPALSESTKAPSNKSSSDSLKSLSDGPSSSSVPLSQGTGTSSLTVQKHGNANSNSMPNYSRQRSFNRRNGATSSANGSHIHPSAQGSVSEMALHSPSSRGHNQRNEIASPSHVGHDNQSQRNSFRNQNGNHFQNHGGWRNHEHGSHHYNSPRNFNGRDSHMQPQRGVPGFMRHQPPPLSSPYIPQAIQPFGSPVGLPEMPSPLYYGPPPSLGVVPYIAPVPTPVFYQVQDPLYARLVHQIDFYFSNANLVRDLFLRRNMDEQGFVRIQLIAGFKKVSELTDNIQFILDALQSSAVVEVQGDKIRKRDDWQKWVIPSTVQFPTVSSPLSRERADQNVLTTQVQNLSLEQNAADQSGSSHHGDVRPQAATTRSSSSDSNTHPQNLSDDAAGEIGQSAGFNSPSGSN